MLAEYATHLIPRRLRQALKRKLLSPTDHINLMTQPPWCSPNVWEQVVATYRKKERPDLFEYGSGASSLQHIRNLLGDGGGSYTAVEHDRAWFGRVCGAVLELAIELGQIMHVGQRRLNALAIDMEMELSTESGIRCAVCLQWRAPDGDFHDGDGSGEQFADYVRAIGDGPYDLIVVDGRARKACVSHVLKNSILRGGGTLALFDAGRGTEGWLGKPTLTGDWDYRPAVQQMRALGGQKLDGIGYFSWPKIHEDFLIGRNNPPVPLEACLLTSSNGKHRRESVEHLSHDRSQCGQ
jgi:hypothetical protein